MKSRVAQRKRAGPITQRSVDRNHALLITFGRVGLSFPLPLRCDHTCFRAVVDSNLRTSWSSLIGAGPSYSSSFSEYLCLV